MRKLFFLTALAALTGCGAATSHVQSTDTTLGRVVVYRNGIAYFERTAHIKDDTLTLRVPADKVDDFLKSLTVVDARTGHPAPISYSTDPSKLAQKQQQEPGSDLIDMDILLGGAAPHDLLLTYVTEAPAWKPSYRMVLDKGGKVVLQAWAIVDNTSGEDWKNVKLGVGSSSALSFRFDLHSIRMVQRETLQSNDLFAQAPPMGGASYANQQQQLVRVEPSRVVVEFSDDALAAVAKDEEQSRYVADKKKVVVSKPQAMPVQAGLGSGYGRAGGTRATAMPPTDPGMAGRMMGGAVGGYYPPPSPQAQQAAQIDAMANALKNSRNQIVVEGYADKADRDKYAASLERANRARERLIRAGVDPNRVVALGNGEQAGRAGGVRIVEAPPPAGEAKPAEKTNGIGVDIVGDPIGTSHFESMTPMTVPRSSSAMVSILNTDTEGEMVYFYDPESARGNDAFPFRAVRLKNPTDSVLESGPVTVFGEGKFIGEGMCEPIPARSVAFVPFALDRQIRVEKDMSESDSIARILTVQRGVFSTEVQHIKKTVLTLHSRMGEKATVYIRHSVQNGFKLVNAPPKRERIGGAYLFRVEVEPGGKTEVTIEEATPLFKSTDIRSSSGMDMVAAFLSSAAEGKLKESVAELRKLQKEMADTEQRIETMREQMNEYRARMDELHAQLVTLKAVKTAGPLMQNLEKKLSEVSDKLSKATVDLVGQQEKLMVAKIRFQDGVAELSLEQKPEAELSGPSKPKG